MKVQKKDPPTDRNITQSIDIAEISRAVRPIVHDTSMDISSTYMFQLLAEPAEYIIHAVWGVKENGRLDGTQKEIHKKTDAVVDAVYVLLDMGEMSAGQAFAICSLTRELIISKIAHSVEIAKGMMNRSKDSCIQNDQALLRDMKVLGTA